MSPLFVSTVECLTLGHSEEKRDGKITGLGSTASVAPALLRPLGGWHHHGSRRWSRRIHGKTGPEEAGLPGSLHNTRPPRTLPLSDSPSPVSQQSIPQYCLPEI